ncbi:MAG: putative molybdenum carrier protein [Proteobacteria bacterium]|nr:putative molybdenum carrier protein [Pseudomonadota bacterium]MBU1581648.1 putative molybdenum carrier protein [Pseudomonadota bacterium]MBU2454555.1 putative molybdenum carrier protein [Pseudomonadota bacterium]MBU2629308.1 putative molybdenum carrier protein [Pseudomonadota bacterium]
MAIKKVISGGQTGADIAGTDAAIACRAPYGGWLPKGRKTENGPVPKEYTEFLEMGRGGYPKRTEQNVIDSDGTVIFTYGKLAGGSSLTKNFSVKNKKPWLHIDLDAVQNPAAKIKDWIIEWDIKVLNVAGKSASKAPGIYDQVKTIIMEVLK